jgi:hypothetical protein
MIAAVLHLLLASLNAVLFAVLWPQGWAASIVPLIGCTCCSVTFVVRVLVWAYGIDSPYEES